jgi:6-phosphofructokinase 1
MAGEFLNKDGNGTTSEFYAYARPLVGSGFPNSHRIRAPKVGKILRDG